MQTTINLSDVLIEEAKFHAKASHRSIALQIEYWAHLGKAAEENPDLPINILKDIILGLEEVNLGKMTEFTFGSLS